MFARTPRLVIRDFEESDWKAAYAFRSDPDVTRYLDIDPDTEEQSKAFVNSCIFHNGQSPRQSHNCAIVLQETGEMIGWIGFGRPQQKDIGDIDFGYALQSTHWGHGYMTEALCALLEFCFRDLGVKSVFGECYVANRASARVMEKAGMRLVGEFPSRRPWLGPLLRYIIHQDPGTL